MLDQHEKTFEERGRDLFLSLYGSGDENDVYVQQARWNLVKEVLGVFSKMLGELIRDVPNAPTLEKLTETVKRSTLKGVREAADEVERECGGIMSGMLDLSHGIQLAGDVEIRKTQLKTAKMVTEIVTTLAIKWGDAMGQAAKHRWADQKAIDRVKEAAKIREEQLQHRADDLHRILRWAMERFGKNRSELLQKTSDLEGRITDLTSVQDKLESEKKVLEGRLQAAANLFTKMGTERETLKKIQADLQAQYDRVSWELQAQKTLMASVRQEREQYRRLWEDARQSTNAVEGLTKRLERAGIRTENGLDTAITTLLNEMEALRKAESNQSSTRARVTDLERSNQQLRSELEMMRSQAQASGAIEEIVKDPESSLRSAVRSYFLDMTKEFVQEFQNDSLLREDTDKVRACYYICQSGNVPAHDIASDELVSLKEIWKNRADLASFQLTKMGIEQIYWHIRAFVDSLGVPNFSKQAIRAYQDHVRMEANFIDIDTGMPPRNPGSSGPESYARR